MPRKLFNTINPFTTGDAGSIARIVTKLMLDCLRPMSVEARMGLSRRKARKLAYRYRGSTRAARYEAYLAGHMGAYMIQGGRLVDQSKLVARLTKLAMTHGSRLQFSSSELPSAYFGKSDRSADSPASEVKTQPL